MRATLGALVLCLLYVTQTEGHVALMDPPARNVLWRAGYPSLPKHEDDDYLLCTEETKKKCPPCGDSADSPKPLPHQAGGEWALGIIGRNYSVGESVRVAVSVSNSHGGYMEFKLCPNNDVKKPVTQSCLDRYPLKVNGYPDGRVPVTAPYQSKQEIDVTVELPKDVHCEQCVLQMSQYAEQFKPSNVMFRNCADIAILDPRASTRSTSNRHTVRSSPSTPKHGSYNNLAAGSSSFGSNSNIGRSPSTSFSGAAQQSSFGGYSAFGSSARRQPQVQPQESHQSAFVDQSSAVGGPSPFTQYSTGGKHDQSFKQPQHFNNINQQIILPGLPPYGGPNAQQRFSTQESSQRFYHQEPTPQQVQQQQFQSTFYSSSAPKSQVLGSHIRRERQPFATAPSKQSVSPTQQFSDSSFPAFSGSSGVQFSDGSNVARSSDSRQASRFSATHSAGAPQTESNIGFSSGSGSSGSEAEFQKRSKSMFTFPIHEPLSFRGIAGPTHSF